MAFCKTCGNFSGMKQMCIPCQDKIADRPVITKPVITKDEPVITKSEYKINPGKNYQEYLKARDDKNRNSAWGQIQRWKKYKKFK